MAGGSMGIIALHMLQTVILVRLLIPADFGIMRLTMSTIAASGMLMNLGVGHALIQKENVDRLTIDTAWVMEMARSLLMFAIVFAAAGPIAEFYAAPLLRPVLRLVSFKFVLVAFRNVGTTLLVKDLNFKRKQILEVGINVAGTTTIVILAILLRNVWALAVGQIIYGLGELCGSYIIHPYRPRFRFDPAAARGLFRFGKYLFLNGLIGFVALNVDSFILGKLLGMTMLGYFSLARSLVRLPLIFVSTALRGVLFPAFSKLQSWPARLRATFARSTAMACFAAFPALMGLAVCAGPAVEVLYTSKYAVIVPVVLVLCFASAAEFAGVGGGPLLWAIGKPHLVVVTRLCHLAVWTPLVVLLGMRYGILGAAVALLIGTICSVALTFALVGRSLGGSFVGIVSPIARPAAASLLMAALIAPLRLLQLQPSAALALIVAFGVGSYVVLTSLLNRRAFDEIKYIAGKLPAQR